MYTTGLCYVFEDEHGDQSSVSKIAPNVAQHIFRQTYVNIKNIKIFFSVVKIAKKFRVFL
jgi:hypothetical protein